MGCYSTHKVIMRVSLWSGVDDTKMKTKNEDEKECVIYRGISFLYLPASV